MIHEVEGMWKEAIMTYFRNVCPNLEKNYWF